MNTLIPPDYEHAQALARLIPANRQHPWYRTAVHRWAQALQRALKQDRTMTLPDLATRYLPLVPTPTPDYSGQWQRNEKVDERLKLIEQRLSNLEVLLRLQELQQDDGK